MSLQSVAEVGRKTSLRINGTDVPVVGFTVPESFDEGGISVAFLFPLPFLLLLQLRQELQEQHKNRWDEWRYNDHLFRE